MGNYLDNSCGLGYPSDVSVVHLPDGYVQQIRRPETLYTQHHHENFLGAINPGFSNFILSPESHQNMAIEIPSSYLQSNPMVIKMEQPMMTNDTNQKGFLVHPSQAMQISRMVKGESPHDLQKGMNEILTEQVVNRSFEESEKNSQYEQVSAKSPLSNEARNRNPIQETYPNNNEALIAQANKDHASSHTKLINSKENNYNNNVYDKEDLNVQQQLHQQNSNVDDRESNHGQEAPHETVDGLKDALNKKTKECNHLMNLLHHSLQIQKGLLNDYLNLYSQIEVGVVPKKNERRVGAYTLPERKKKIEYFKQKQKKRRNLHPVSRIFEGRRRAAKAKSRMMGRFIKNSGYLLRRSLKKKISKRV